MSEIKRKQIIEAAIFAAAEPISVERLQQLFEEITRPSAAEIKVCVTELAADYQDRGVELQEVASGYRFQAKTEFAPWLQRLWEKKPPRYSRALLETLALIVYRQPISRGEIEEIRGVVVSTEIMKKLLEHEWIKIVGYRDVPGKPAMFGTTKKFLDYFNLKNLSDLPALESIVDLDQMEKQLTEQLGLVEIVNEVTADIDLELAEIAENDQLDHETNTQTENKDLVTSS
jgi:segregation and condensation protein B